MLLGRHKRHRGVDAHAARVGTEVTLEGALVVLGAREGNDGRAVSEGKQGALGALQHLFDDDGRTSLAKGAGEALANALEGLLHRLGDDDALAGSEAIGLHDAGTIELADVLLGGVGLGKALVASGGDTGALHDLLGEDLRPLHLGRLARGAKASDASSADGVSDTGDERSLGANNNEADAVLGRKAGDGGGVVLVNVRELGLGEDAAVAGRRPDLARARALGELTKHRVLATASTK